MPANYIDRQFKFNALHSDGTAISYKEEALQCALELVAFIRQNYPHVAKPSFLDVGCRLGYCLPLLQAAYPAGRVVGIDIVPEFIEAASQVGEAEVADMHALPYQDREFDFVLCVQTLEHCYDVITAIKELKRVTRNAMYISVPLETLDAFNANLSHYARARRPTAWLQLFDEEYLKLRLAYNSDRAKNYFNFLFQREY